MKLSAKFLENVANINCFDYVDQWDISEGSAHSLCFQIVDKHKHDLRYLSQATVIDAVTVTFPSIDEDAVIVKTATQKWADDKSIWCIELTADEVPGSGSVQISITEDTVETKFNVEYAIIVDLLEIGSC